MFSWREFVSRSPEEYVAWLDGTSREAAQLEIIQLLRLSQSGKKIFVGTNTAPERLKQISSWDHVAILLSPQSLSVERFFDRPDAEKQFLYRTKEELLEAKKQLASTVHKLKEVVKTLEAKPDPVRYRSQLTLARRRIAAFTLAAELVEERLTGEESSR